MCWWDLWLLSNQERLMGELREACVRMKWSKQCIILDIKRIIMMLWKKKKPKGLSWCSLEWRLNEHNSLLWKLVNWWKTPEARPRKHCIGSIWTNNPELGVTHVFLQLHTLPIQVHFPLPWRLRLVKPTFPKTLWFCGQRKSKMFVP